MIDKTRLGVFRSVSISLNDLYWQIGEYISTKIEHNEWGASIVENLAEYLLKNVENSKGFSRQNLWRMKQYFEAYRNLPILSPLVREISWSNNLIILARTKTTEEREFYIKLCIKEHYSKNELTRQINASLFERTMLTSRLNMIDASGTAPDNHHFKDDYVFEFLGLKEEFSEQD